VADELRSEAVDSEGSYPSGRFDVEGRGEQLEEGRQGKGLRLEASNGSRELEEKLHLRRGFSFLEDGL